MRAIILPVEWWPVYDVEPDEDTETEVPDALYAKWVKIKKQFVRVQTQLKRQRAVYLKGGAEE